MKENNEQKLEKRIADLADKLEKSKITDYVSLLENPKRMLFLQFISGLARGFGMAIGFTVLGALLIYFLQKLVIWNLPLISDFIADIIRMVREQYY